MRGNRGLSNGPESSYVKRALHQTSYDHKKKVDLERNFSIGSHCIE